MDVMTTKPEPQIAAITQPYGAEPPVVHCPICGKAQLRVMDGAAEVDPCEHLAFSFIWSEHEFVYRSEEFRGRFEALEARMPADDDLELDIFERIPFREMLLEMGYGDQLLVLEISYGGLTHVPLWHTDAWGFDYGVLARRR